MPSREALGEDREVAVEYVVAASARQHHGCAAFASESAETDLEGGAGPRHGSPIDDEGLEQHRRAVLGTNPADFRMEGIAKFAQMGTVVAASPVVEVDAVDP